SSQFYCDGLLAQLVEQRTLNPSVECSSHSQPTRNIKDLGASLGPFLLPTCAAICDAGAYPVVFGSGPCLINGAQHAVMRHKRPAPQNLYRNPATNRLYCWRPMSTRQVAVGGCTPG